MLTSVKLAHLVGAATSIPRATSLMYLRYLLEAKPPTLTSSGARGINAPVMSEMDAARLLTSVLATERPADAAKAVRSFGPLVIVVDGIPVVSPGGFLIDKSDDAAMRLTKEDGENFEEHLAALMRKLSTTDSTHTISVSIDVAQMYCNIDVDGMHYGYSHPILRNRANNKSEDIEPFFALRQQYENAKIRVRREIREDVLAVIAASFRNEEEAADAKLRV
jgi:hypothetical protein